MCANGKCKECAYWKENPHGGVMTIPDELITGECHRLPPTTDGHLTFFPNTNCNSWCGEFKKSKMAKTL